MDKEVKYLYLDDIIPNRFQPRENFDEKALKELAVSIKEHGVIQPIIVRQIGEKYEIIAGERRYKASTMAGLTKIPAIITNLDDKESSKVALIENLQRKDLTPIEEARTYQKILELDALTQEELARTMGKSQSAVSNKLRLLALTEEVQDALLHEQISERHARSLLSVEDPRRQVELLNKVISTRMTVRELEEEINGAHQSESKEIPRIIDVASVDSNSNINPTTVDINKIKNETEDIKPIEPKIDFESLLKPMNNEMPRSNSIETSSLNLESNNLDKQDEILPQILEKPDHEVIGGSGLLAGMTIDETTKTEATPVSVIPDIQSTGLFDKAIEEPKSVESIIDTLDNKQTSDNNMLFGNSDTIEIKEEQPNPSGEASDITNTVKTVKDTVENIKNTGKKVEMEEFDFEDFYQIVIRIDK